MTRKIPLMKIAHAKSGDKGNSANIGLIAKKPAYYSILEKYITADAVKEHFQGVCHGDVIRYDLPKVFALNFILEDALGGGSTRSLRMDTQGKTMGEALLMMNVEIPDGVYDIEE